MAAWPVVAVLATRPLVAGRAAAAIQVVAQVFAEAQTPASSAETLALEVRPVLAETVAILVGV